MPRIAGPNYTATFKYDALNRRIEKTVNGATTRYVYDGAQAIAEITGSAITATYLTGLQLDEVLARFAGSGNKTLLTDALGSVIAQANDQQGIQNFYAYTPYGEAQTLGPDDNNPIQYTARENDQTGLYYYRARYYDPVLKRFIQEDPIGLAGGINTYRYVNNNPLSYIDPTGRFIQFVLGIPALLAELGVGLEVQAALAATLSALGVESLVGRILEATQESQLAGIQAQALYNQTVACEKCPQFGACNGLDQSQQLRLIQQFGIATKSAQEAELELLKKLSK